METMQQPKITGYRQLSPEEAALMNKIKAVGQQLQELVQEVELHIDQQFNEANEAFFGDSGDGEQFERLRQAAPLLWSATAATTLSTGLMQLTRAVAQPSSF